jgi:hypothetical protein
MRTREDLAEMRLAAANQLGALLETWRPDVRSLFADIGSPATLEFLTRYPTHASAAELGWAKGTWRRSAHGKVTLAAAPLPS